LAVAVIVGWTGAASAVAPTTPTTPTTPGDTVPIALQPAPPIASHDVVSSPLVVVPPGCNPPDLPVAVFVGTLAATDATTGRFAIQQIRAGRLDGYAVETMVDIRYTDDIRFLRVGQSYLVGAGRDVASGTLQSKVRVPSQLFGGDAVISANDSDVRCPRSEDGVTTLTVDGLAVDTGVLAPLKSAKQSMAKAVLKPLVVAFFVLVVLAAIKLLIVAAVRSIREADDDRETGVAGPFRASRQRRHADDPDDADGQGAEADQSATGGDGSGAQIGDGVLKS
jgi:hypothetical protein